MKKTLLILIVAVLFSATAAAQNVVKASGIGTTKRDATYAAQRLAVEQGLGTLIDSESLTQNFMLVEDKILSKARGYVKSYTVISEKQEVDGTWTVTIEAVVAQGDLKNDLNALGILREKMGNPRILVLYDPTVSNSLDSPNNPVVAEAYDGIIEYLTDKEFPVVSKRIADQFTLRKFSSSEEIYKESVGFGLNNQAEYILVFNVKSEPQKKTSVFYRGRVMISAKLINTSTAQIIAADNFKVTGTDKDAQEFAMKKGGRKGGAAIGKFISQKLIKRWESETVSGRAVALELLNVPDFSMLIEFKSKLQSADGVKNLIQRNSTKNSVEYEVTFVGDIGRLKESIYKIFESMYVTIAPPTSGGDRVTVDFSKNPEDVEEEELWDDNPQLESSPIEGD
ncbi:MAG TPA: hypothetical protein ENN72_00590 [Firmicutes bacterium]|nr:hypothetical protein [Bacillota bacterium]